MAIDFNHTIVWAKDRDASAAFLAEKLGLPAPGTFGPFKVAATANGVNVDFMQRDGEIAPQALARRGGAVRLLPLPIGERSARRSPRGRSRAG